MRVAFAGTPDFACMALEQLVAAGFTVPLVLTQPDRPAGRGMKLQPSPVKQFAVERGIPVVQPRSLRLEGKYPDDAATARAAIEAVHVDVMVVAAYGLILPQWVLDVPRLGCLNIHASLLPRWRGAAPIHRAIEAGDEETGITIMQMDAGLDTGDMLVTERVRIAEGDTTATLHDKLALLGAMLAVEALEIAACGGFQPVKQPAEGITYAHKIEKAESLVDWSHEAVAIERRIRAFDPFPGASSTLNGETVKLWSAQAIPTAASTAPAGHLVAVAPDSFDVQCGAGLLRVKQVQRPGGKRLAVADFLRGFDVKPGMAFAPHPH